MIATERASNARSSWARSKYRILLRSRPRPWAVGRSGRPVGLHAKRTAPGASARRPDTTHASLRGRGGVVRLGPVAAVRWRPGPVGFGAVVLDCDLAALVDAGAERGDPVVDALH